ncbi:unnamed protein product [Orchesella dallaii]|uniref:CWH43-like N-terminal domain-containing protein n=1 Tax=Orchesella dallaii TaxID=48710 RepID=A0ABP1RCJ7_9HEXA
MIYTLTEEDLKEEFLDDSFHPSSSSGSLRSLRLPWHVFRIPFRHAIRVVLALPLGAFIFAILWAMYTDYDRAVNVLCANEDGRKIRNYLPSLSAAIGDFPVSRAVWTTCVVLHAPPRFLFGSMYLQYFESIVPSSMQSWVFAAWISSVLELLGLVGLSIITSGQNLPFHAFCFAIFLIFSELYMLLQCYLQSKMTKGQAVTGVEAKSLKIKKCLTKLIIVCTVMLFIVYFRHEAKCEQGMYTIFAFIEYVVILANMGFHVCAYWDFYDRVIVIDILRPLMSPNTKNLSWDF